MHLQILVKQSANQNLHEKQSPHQMDFNMWDHTLDVCEAKIMKLLQKFAVEKITMVEHMSNDGLTHPPTHGIRKPLPARLDHHHARRRRTDQVSNITYLYAEGEQTYKQYAGTLHHHSVYTYNNTKTKHRINLIS